MRSAIILIALFSLVLPSAAIGQRWEELGSKRVSFAAERDVIPVGSNEGRFNAVRLEVEAGNLEMYNVRIVFGDGTSFSPTARHRFRQGESSRVIDLPGNARVIRSVSFSYSSTLRRGRARIQLFGRHAGGGEPSNAGAPAIAPVLAGWEHVGSRLVAFRSDRDVISAAGEGHFRRLRFGVRDGDLEMFDVRIHFANGESYSPPTRLVFDERDRSREFDLPGGNRLIRRIEFHYRSIAGGGEGRATIHVYGR